MSDGNLRQTEPHQPEATEAPLTERQRRILRLIVREYVDTGRPVGSRALVESSGIGVSSATIRNEMAELEERGYLQHLHTSGGRIPTDKGYRFFVTNLMGDVELSPDEQLTILHQFRQVEIQLEQWLELAAVTLARAAGNVSLVSAPIPQTPRVHHLEIVSLRKQLGLVIFVTADGAVRQVMARLPEAVEQAELSALADSLRPVLRGQTAMEIEAQIAGASPLARAILEPIAAAMRGAAMASPAVRHSGLEHVLRLPDFSDADEAQELLTMLLSGTFVSTVLPRLEGDSGVRVFIGQENPANALRRFGVVVSTYGVDGEVMGVLGVVGPTRMAYDRSISSVKYMAKLMSNMVANLQAG